MIVIKKATIPDNKIIADIGRVSVEEAHRESSSAEEMQEFLQKNYSYEAITNELSDPDNVYHTITVDQVPAGFSKIILNKSHANIAKKNVTKLDRIYLLKEFLHLKLGTQLLAFNIELAKASEQSGIWLFTWVENKRAVNFYKKNGFEIIGTHQFKVTDTHYNENHHMLLLF